MTITLKQYADYFAIALEIGLPVKDEIITWADNLILAASDPLTLEWKIDLATSKNKSIQDTIDLLRKVPGKTDLNVSFRLVIAKISILYPSIDFKNIKLFFDLYVWYLNNEEIERDISIIDSHRIMELEEGYITKKDINQDYKKFIEVSNNCIQYLPM